MTSRQQRFCPVCDRSFEDGEAVLRCQGCGVMHHPACWVRTGGCSTTTEHEAVPAAIAYSLERLDAPAPHPGEGTRVLRVESPPAGDPIALRGRVKGQAEATREVADDGVVIGEPVAHEQVGGAPRRPGPRRYPPPPGDLGMRKPMPRVYGRHHLLQYWYVLAAVALAAVVALAVIGVGGLVIGDDGDGNAPGAGGQPTSVPSTPTRGPAQTQPPQTSPSPAATVTVTGTPAASSGKFRPNDVVVVTGTTVGAGAEGCLNVRTKPGTENPAIVCVPDGTSLTVVGGPETAGGRTWWNVKLSTGDGWAAEEYLVKR